MTWILHIDGDSFFASVEMSLNPRLRGKAVVTGEERGIATAMSKAAKALGVHRGMPVFKIRELYPEVVIVKSDYHHYKIFAERMYNIVRRYTPYVEEYSIDECFADLSDVSDPVETARKIKYDLQKELGMTFSLGLGPTKVIAKVASKWNKPDGFTVIYKEDIHDFLKDLPVGKVWGIGPSTSANLQRMNISTALELTERPLEWIRAYLDKRELELWYELRGERALKVHFEDPDDQSSLQKTRTFGPPTMNKSFIFSELSKNVELACAKARDHNLLAKHIYYFLKTQEFRYHRFEIRLPQPTDAPHIILKEIKKTFADVYKHDTVYRATGVTLGGLVPGNFVQPDLFGDSTKTNAVWDDVYKAVDKVAKRFGSHTVILGSSLNAFKRQNQKNDENHKNEKKALRTISKKRLKIPFMGEVD